MRVAVAFSRYRSQWSLTFEVRKRHFTPLKPPWRRWSQWSLTFEVRKRAFAFVYRDQYFVSQWSLTFEVRKRRHRCDA